jgi:Pectate lyase superfamily protein
MSVILTTGAAEPGPAGTAGAQGAAGNGFDNTVVNVKNAPYSAHGDGLTDDTAAIQAAIDAVATAGGGSIYFPAGVYIVAGELVTSYGGRSDYNSQLCVPVTPALVLFGPEPAEATGASASDPAASPPYAVIKSTLSSASGTTPALIGGGTTWGTFLNTDIVLRNIVLRCPTNPNLGGGQFGALGNVRIDEVTIDAGEGYGASTEPTNNQAWGLIMPQGDVGTSRIGSLYVQGFWVGVAIGDNVQADLIETHSCQVAVSVKSAAKYPPQVRKLCVWDCPYGIAYAIPGTGLADLDTAAGITVDQYDSEHYPLVYGSWTTRIADVWDQQDGEVGGGLQAEIGFNAGPTTGWPPIVKAYSCNWYYGSAGHGLVYVVGDYLNGWSTNGASINPQYATLMMDRTGMVHLFGEVNGGTLNTAVFNLPRPFQPITDHVGVHKGLTYTGSAWEAVPVIVNATDIVVQESPCYLNGLHWMSSDRVWGLNHTSWPPVLGSN